ncbi:odorant receptor 13a-like isoform X2 [Fopius arisanus]|uniref:Odorant receptor 13a-like isoform X2 n=1 Tax=Fopius arisanus TaxID=64838 RepID=A0A9R1TDF5_9HYME|nr:PREDICTED: odorant receptor 13a-like isoform X2 [Fopius arisanus]
MVKGFSLGTSFVSIALKVFLFTFYRESSIELHTTLHNYHKESMSDENLHQFVLKRVTGFSRLTLILTVLVYNGCFMYLFIPLITIIVEKLQHVPITYLLPVTALYPWEISPGGLLYTLTYIYEGYNILCLGIVTCGVDSLFGYYIFHIIGQLRVLSYDIMTIKSACNVDVLIRKWIKKFVVLKGCCNILQKIYGPIIVWQIVTNSAVICTVLFQISQAKRLSLGRYILIIGYSGTKIIQTYIYSWAGSVLMLESEGLSESVYFSNWLEQCQRFKTSILFILTQKPLKITAASCMTVSTEMFIMTLNTAVSYFFLLKTFEEQQS